MAKTITKEEAKKKAHEKEEVRLKPAEDVKEETKKEVKNLSSSAAPDTPKDDKSKEETAPSSEGEVKEESSGGVDAKKSASGTDANETPEPQVLVSPRGANLNGEGGISDGQVHAQETKIPAHNASTIIPIASEAKALREQAFKPKDITLSESMRVEFDLGANQHEDGVGTTLKSSIHTYSAAAQIVGTKIPGCDAVKVDPAAKLTPRVADPIQTADVEFQFRPEPVFADKIDEMTFKIQLNSEKEAK